MTTTVASAQKLADFRPNFSQPFAHQRFADENRFCPATLKTLDISARVNAAFSHEKSRGSIVEGRVLALDSRPSTLDYLRSDLFGRCQIDFESFEIAIVHANQRSIDGQRALQFPVVVNFHQH